MFCINLNAQNETQLYIHLINGSVIKGQIVKQDTDGVTIATSDGQQYNYSSNDILKISPFLESQNNIEYRHDSHNGLRKGFRCILSGGHNFGISDYGENSFEFNSSFGCQLNPHLYLGGGLSIMYLYDRSELLALPVYANFRYDILNKRVCPYVDLKAGYSTFDAHGLYFTGGVGCRFHIKNKMGISIFGGYEAFIAEYGRYGSYKNIGDIMGRLCFEF